MAQTPLLGPSPLRPCFCLLLAPDKTTSCEAGCGERLACNRGLRAVLQRRSWQLFGIHAPFVCRPPQPDASALKAAAAWRPATRQSLSLSLSSSLPLPHRCLISHSPAAYTEALLSKLDCICFACAVLCVCVCF
ncbi:hypothetical protein DL89DRAFT_144613 [Linderina pennispora]|uniref:Uncharacterized protein n=1 Tax=Linderina pennispora TaxID=61395 RepID=A0A1Y1VVL3_9FUNG|nr:uncharacterized protein DL89DRAFT_144613 [Linderina pennispora]ORX65036.1 hypothetical protein DL89DRAFT_144613 [Linderina pennispora]